MSSTKPEDVVTKEVQTVLEVEQSLQAVEDDLAKNEQFRNFLEKQKVAREFISSTWKKIESTMIDNDVKSVKGEWGSITIAERTNYTVDLEQLPSKFIKKVADTTKIGTFHKLENKLPKGVTKSTTKYLTKRIK